MFSQKKKTIQTTKNYVSPNATDLNESRRLICFITITISFFFFFNEIQFYPNPFLSDRVDDRDNDSVRNINGVGPMCFKKKKNMSITDDDYFTISKSKKCTAVHYIRNNRIFENDILSTWEDVIKDVIDDEGFHLHKTD